MRIRIRGDAGAVDGCMWTILTADLAVVLRLIDLVGGLLEFIDGDAVYSRGAQIRFVLL